METQQDGAKRIQNDMVSDGPEARPDDIFGFSSVCKAKTYDDEIILISPCITALSQQTSIGRVPN